MFVNEKKITKWKQNKENRYKTFFFVLFCCFFFFCLYSNTQYSHIQLHLIYKLVWDPIFRGTHASLNFTWLTIFHILRSIITHITQEDKRSRFVFSSPWKELDYKTLNAFVRRIYFSNIVFWLFVQKLFQFNIHLYTSCIITLYSKEKIWKKKSGKFVTYICKFLFLHFFGISVLLSLFLRYNNFEIIFYNSKIQEWVYCYFRECVLDLIYRDKWRLCMYVSSCISTKNKKNYTETNTFLLISIVQEHNNIFDSLLIIEYFIHSHLWKTKSKLKACCLCFSCVYRYAYI